MAKKSVDALLNDIRYINEAHYQLVQEVRALVRDLVKTVSEEVKYGGILFSSDVMFAGVFAYKDHVTVEFGQGAKIQDTFGFLEGSGKFRRHIKLKLSSDIEDRRLADYVRLALEVEVNEAASSNEA
jgi:hypothetical protein